MTTENNTQNTAEAKKGFFTKTVIASATIATAVLAGAGYAWLHYAKAQADEASPEVELPTEEEAA